MTQRDGTWREEGRGFRMGNTCTPVVDSRWCMTKPIQYCKVKKKRRRRIDAFELWCWRRLLRVPGTARRSNQTILKEISPGCSPEGLMLKMKLQYFRHLMRRADSFEKTLMLGKIEGRRRRGRQTEDEMVGWHHWLSGHGFGWPPGVGDGPGGLVCCGSWGCKELDSTEQLNWTKLIKYDGSCRFLLDVLYQIKEVSSIPSFLKGFFFFFKLWMDVEFCQMAFSTLIDTIMYFLSFRLLMWLRLLIDFFFLYWASFAPLEQITVDHGV